MTDKSFTITTSKIGSDAAKMEMVKAVTSPDADITSGNALIWSNTSELTTYYAATDSKASEVTALKDYTDGYTIGFTYEVASLGLKIAAQTANGGVICKDGSAAGTCDKETVTGTKRVDQWGICVAGSEGTGDKEIKGTSCAGT